MSAALLVAGAAPALAVAPPSDGKGYLDSTARCTSPDIAVVFGSTESSRVAVCRDAAGQYEYRGVRVRDGAKLIVPAVARDGGFVATSDGITYTVTDAALVISAGGTVIRREPMLDLHGSVGAAPAPAAPKPAPAPAPAPKPTADAPSNPLPAEVGGSAANG